MRAIFIEYFFNCRGIVYYVYGHICHSTIGCLLDCPQTIHRMSLIYNHLTYVSLIYPNPIVSVAQTPSIPEP